MTRRDLTWRLAGAALTAASWGICAVLDGSPLIIPFFVLALLGLPLVIHGKRVGQVLRAEKRGHWRTAEAIHLARIRRRGRADNGPR